MRRFCAFLSVVGLLAVPAFADGGWKMFDRRLGMFIHWGCYSVGEWHEQDLARHGFSRAEYEAKFAPNFKAEKFDADEFVKVAKSAGAEYIVFTSKHHDGFCMWDTKTTDYKVTNTPVGRDVVGELATACRKGGLKLGLYYSNPDWHHPNSHNEKSTHQIPLQPGDEPDMEKYIAYVKAQITELLTNYGEICCLFWDIPTNVERPEMDALVRSLQPGIMINNRGWGNRETADYSTPERDFGEEKASNRNIEACDAVGNQSWGFRRNEDYHTIGYCTRSIDRFLSGGGNFLLNVGPKPDGTIADEDRAIMSKVGAWMARVGESFDGVEGVTNLVSGARAAPHVFTRRGNVLYVHFPDGLNERGIDLAPLDKLPKKAVLLNDGRELGTELEVFPASCQFGKACAPTLHIRGIPADDLANEAVVVKLEFEEL